MSTIKELTQSPEYEAAASSASKAACTVFIITFGYMTFFSGVNSGLLGGIAFFVVGLFVVSVAIAMPLFILTLKVPKVSLLVSLIEILVTIFLTRFVYLLVFSSSAVAAQQDVSGEFTPRSFQCSEPLPEFTLDRYSDPSDAELSDLCACIYSRLPSDTKAVSIAIAQENTSDLNATTLQSYIQAFRSALDSCGGNSL